MVASAEQRNRGEGEGRVKEERSNEDGFGKFGYGNQHAEAAG